MDPMNKRWYMTITLFSWILLQQTVEIKGDNSGDNAPQTWYIGCYEDHRNAARPFSYNLLESPVQCSRNCYLKRKRYALVQTPSHCFCVDDLENMTRVQETECNLRCPRDITSICGGSGAFSVFSTQGPYIAEVQYPGYSPITSVGKPVNISLRVVLAAPPDYPTGLDRYSNEDLGAVNITISFSQQRTAYSLRIPAGKTSVSLDFSYTPDASGFFPYDVLVRNAMSSKENRDYIEVVSPIPQNLDVVSYSASSTCVPNAPEYSGYNRSQGNQNYLGAVATGVETTFGAHLFSGVNVTFEWNICNLRHIRSNNKTCRLCRNDKQKFTFPNPRMCEITVTAFNSHGSVSKTLLIAIVNPVIKNLRISLQSCDITSPCFMTLFPPQWFLPSPNLLEVPSRNFHKQVLLPDGSYFSGTKICFHATVEYIHTSLYLGIRVDFGDGTFLRKNISTIHMRGKRSGRSNPRFYSGLNPYEGQSGSSNNSSPNSPVIESNYHDLQSCYNENDCIFNLLFNKRYRTIGQYVVRIQLFNTTHRISTTLKKKLNIVGDGLNMHGLICKNVSVTNNQTEFRVRNADGHIIKWDIIPMNDPSLIRVSRVDVSPFRHVFNHSGQYEIRINNGELCMITVEDRVADLSIIVGSRFVAVSETFQATIFLAHGTNVATSWKYLNQSHQNIAKRNARFSENLLLTQTEVGCNQISLKAFNMASMLTIASDIICGEERIEGLVSNHPQFVDFPQKANLTVSYARGSNVQISVIIKSASGLQVRSFHHTSGQTFGPFSITFSIPVFPFVGVFQVKVVAWNNVSRISIPSIEIHVDKIINDFRILNLFEQGSVIMENERNVLMAVVNDVPSSVIMYTWVYYGTTNNSEPYTTTIQTTSPVVSFIPRCFRVSPCLVTVTAKSSFNQSELILDVTSINRRQPRNFIQAPVVTTPCVEIEVLVDCISKNSQELGCQVTFSDDGFSTQLSANRPTTLSHSFAQAGLYSIDLQVLNSVPTTNHSFYVSVQEELSNLTIQGDVLQVNQRTVGKWYALFTNGTNLIYEWRIKVHNQSDYIASSAKSSYDREFNYQFARAGLYQVCLFVFNDVSEMNASITVEVRNTSVYEDTTTSNTEVFDVATHPTLFYQLKLNGTVQQKPYHVNLGDDVIIVVHINNQITNVQWTVKKYVEVIINTTLPVGEEQIFDFPTTSTGIFNCFLKSAPVVKMAQFDVTIHSPVTELSLDPPYTRYMHSSVENCVLRSSYPYTYLLDETYSCTPLIFFARSNGEAVVFRFQFHLQGNSTPFYVMEVNSTGISGSLNPLQNFGRIEYTFTEPGVYNISVSAYNTLQPNRTVMTRYLNFPFYVETLPMISMNRREDYVQLGKAITLTIRNLKPEHNLTVDWNMGDGTKYLNAGNSVNHTYSTYGRYTVDIVARNHVGRATLIPRIYVQRKLESVRIATPIAGEYYPTTKLLDFVANITPSDSGVTYKWYFEEALAPTIERYSNMTRYKFLYPGEYSVKVVAKNAVGEVVSPAVNLTLIEPVASIIIQGPNVAVVGVSTRYYAMNLGGTDVVITWDMGDGNLLENSTYGVNHTFTRVGVFMISVTLRNPLGPVTASKQIFVMKTLCELPTLRIPLKGMTSTYYGSRDLHFEALLTYSCAQVYHVVYNWTITPFVSIRGNNNETAVYSGQGQILTVPANILDQGNYQVTANVTLIGSIMYATTSVYIRINPSPPVAFIDGGSVRTLSRESHIVINASQSYDPDDLSTKLLFSWECFVLDSAQKSCFQNTSVQQSVSNVNSRYFDQQDNPTYNSSIYMNFPQNIVNFLPSLSFYANQLRQESSAFVFKVKVRKNGSSSLEASTTFLLRLSGNSAKRVTLSCPTCTKKRMSNKHQGAVFIADCPGCANDDIVYSWSIKLVNDRSRSFYKNESSDCAPPDGNGWLGWNQTAANMLLPNETDTAETPRNNTATSPIFLHPDDANFTGNLAPIGGVGGPPVGNGDSPWGLTEANSGTFEQTPGINEWSPSPFGGIGEGLSEGGTGNSPFSQSMPNLGLGDNSEYVSLPQEDYNSMSPTSNNIRSGDNNLDPAVVESSLAEGETSSREIFDATNERPRPMFRPQRRYFTSDSLISSDTQSGVRIENHYQEFRHTDLPLSNLATVEKSGRVLFIKPNTLVEGKTYQVSASISSRNSQVQGSTSYYIRVNRGPSYGLCSVLHENNFDRFKVHCFQWQNRQSDVLDTTDSLNEMLHYHLTYSIGKLGIRRHIYSGYSHDNVFLLPASRQQVYIYVEIYNAVKTKTNVCSFPVVVTRIGQPRNDSAVEDLNYVYNKSIGNATNLKHEVVKGDQGAILGYVNVMVDTLPISLLNSSQYGKKYRAITSRLVYALSKVKSIPYASDVIGTLSHILSFINSTDCATIAQASSTASKALLNAKLDMLTSNNMEIGSQLALSFQFQEKIETIIHDSTRILEKLSTFRNLQRSTRHNNTRLCFRADLNTGIYIQTLRTFLLDYTRMRDLPSLNVSFDSLVIKTQLENETLMLKNEKGGSSAANTWVGAIFPNSSLHQSGMGIYQTGIVYFESSPFVAKSMVMVDKTAFSLWVTNSVNDVMATSGLKQPIIIYLPPRKELFHNQGNFPFQVSSSDISVHEVNLTVSKNATVHIQVDVDAKGGRPFFLNAALSDMPLSVQSPFINKHVFQQDIIPPRRARSTKQSNTKSSVKFTISSNDRNGQHYISLWTSGNAQGALNLDKTIKYDLKVWISDCYFWNSKRNKWRKTGVKALPESTPEQTVCSTSHLSTFTSSFRRLQFISYSHIIVVVATTNALTPCLTVLLVIIFGFLGLLLLHRYCVRKQGKSNEKKTSNEGRSLGLWLRWYFGSDDRSASERVPVILQDNKAHHKQIFEVTIQTGSWPGSGTTSLANLILYGRDGKYKGRELVPPSEVDDDIQVSKLQQDKQCLFETGSSKTFILTFPKNLGPLRKLSIWHDHSEPWPRWFIDYIIIRDVISHERWYFPCNTWLALDKGGNRISRDLTPVKAKPPLLRHLAIKIKRNMLNYHSLLSLFACARWGGLTRAQRIVHSMSLCLLVMCVSTATDIVFVIGKDFHYGFPWFTAENWIWAFGIGVIACLILLPAQLMFRYLKHDERIALLIEDTTSGNPDTTSHYSGLVMEYKFSEESNFNSHVSGGGLHKTSTISHGLSVLDHIMHEGPTSNEVVSDWLQIEKWNSSKSRKDSGFENCDSGHHTVASDHSTRSWLPTPHSVSSYDEEIARCMMTSPTSLPSACMETDCVVDYNKESDHEPDHICTEDTSYFDDCSSIPPTEELYEPHHTAALRCDNQQLKSNKRSSDAEFFTPKGPAKHSRRSGLAYDAPVLVPCEKLEPLPKEQSAALPRKCSYIAWAYYTIVGTVSCAVIIYGAAYKMRRQDFLKWFETVFSALFLALIFLETVLAIGAAVISTIWDTMRKTDISQTLRDLFPTVDAAPVDDYAYKSQHDTAKKNVKIEEPDPSELKHLLFERRRSRYLRNISPPYDHNGRWRKPKHPLRKQAKDLRRKSAVNRAWKYWVSCLFLSLIVFTIVMKMEVKSEMQMRQTRHVRTWFESGFHIDEDFVVHPSTTKELLWDTVNDIPTWKNWFQTTFLTKDSYSSNGTLSVHHSTKSNYLIVGSVTLTLMVKKSPGCNQFSTKIQKIVGKKKCMDSGEHLKQCDQNRDYYITNKMNVNLLDPNLDYFSNSPDVASDAVGMMFLTYNAVVKQYSLVQTFVEFGSMHSEHSKVEVKTYGLGLLNAIQQDWSVWCHVILVIWCSATAFMAIINLAEYGTLSKPTRRELSHRSLSKSSTFSLLLESLLWMAVVGYLSFWRLLRFNSLNLAALLERTGHAGDGYPAMFVNVFNSDYWRRLFLGVWTVLIVVKFINLTISLHGPRSSFSRSMTAVCRSFWNNLLSLILPFIFIIILFSMLGYLVFGTLVQRHSNVFSAIQQSLLDSVWLGLIGGNKSNNIKEYSEHFGISGSIFYFGILFFTSRIMMKALVASSHQIELRKLKSNKGNNARKTTKALKRTSISENSSISSTLSNSGIISRSKRCQQQRYVSFSDMSSETLSEICTVIDILATSIFGGTYPQWLRTFQIFQKSSDHSDTNSINEPKVSSYLERKKLGEEQFCMTTGNTTGELTKMANKVENYCYSMDNEDMYELSTDVALSEVKLQVNELYERATALINEEMDAIPASIAESIDPGFYSFDESFSSFSKQLAHFANRHVNNDDDDMHTIFTSYPPTPSRSTSIDSSTSSPSKINKSETSLRGNFDESSEKQRLTPTHNKNKSDSFCLEDDKPSGTRSIRSVTPWESRSQQRKTLRKEELTSAVERSRKFVKLKPRKQRFSKWPHDCDFALSTNSDTAADSPSLMKIGIERFNTEFSLEQKNDSSELHGEVTSSPRKHRMSKLRPDMPCTSTQLGGNSESTTPNSISSNNFRNEGKSDSSVSSRTSGLLRSLLGPRKWSKKESSEQTTRKARPLRRSKTIFIDVKQIPTIGPSNKPSLVVQNQSKAPCFGYAFDGATPLRKQSKLAARSKKKTAAEDKDVETFVPGLVFDQNDTTWLAQNPCTVRVNKPHNVNTVSTATHHSSAVHDDDDILSEFKRRRRLEDTN